MMRTLMPEDALFMAAVILKEHLNLQIEIYGLSFLLTSDLQKHTYATFCTLHHTAMFRGIDENEAFLF